MSQPAVMPASDDSREALLDLLLMEEQLAVETPPQIQPLPADSPRPLSWAQRRLWFLDQMGLTGNSYNVPANFRLLGRLDRAALEGSLREIVNRHETLRTTFHMSQGEPFQRIAPPLDRLHIEVEILRGCDPRDRDALIRDKTIEENNRRFDLSRHSPFRVRLLELDDFDHVLMLSFHHIAADGWSMMNFARELSALYRAFHSGQPSPLPPIQITYADFAAWQTQSLRGERLESLLKYWRGYLDGATPTMVPSDYPRPNVERFLGAGRDFYIPAPIFARLEELGAKHNATTYMVMLAIFTALIHRYTGEERITVGSPIANRNREETEPLIGFFVNALVMSTAVDERTSFTELLLRTKDGAIGAFAHQDMPFEELVEALRPERSLTGNPLFRIMFAVQQTEAMQPVIDLAGLDVSQVMLGQITVRFDLEIHLWPSGGGLQGFLIYNTDLYNAATMRRLCEHMIGMAGAVAEQPDAPIGELSFLNTREQEDLWLAAGTEVCEYPLLPVHKRFEASASARPDAVAVVDGDRVLTYRELDRASNRLASVLRQRGVGADVPVAISMERSAELIIGLLAILKAGGAYLPVDPAYPEARKRVMTEGAHLWLIDPGAADPGGKVPFLRFDDPFVTGAPDASLDAVVGPDNLAYINFTSGSTGEPKGIAIPHRAVLRLLSETSFEVGENRCFGNISNISFDATTFEIWAALIYGARLVIIPRSIALVPNRLAAMLQEQRVTTMFLTCTLFNQVVDEIPDAFTHMQMLLVGGEALDPTHVDLALRNGPPQNLLNAYGPTESTTFACTHRITEVPAGATSIPIGRPIANTSAFVLDPKLRLAATGMPGELLLGGDGLARGYFGQPDLTAERFVPDPFSRRFGARLYRTGDLCRWRLDFTLDYLGRVDQQVKIRGYRIEPGEIEARLLAVPSVKEAAVAVRENARGERQLVAYIVRAAHDSGQTEQVEAWKTLFDQKIYAGHTSPADSRFNTAGWISSYNYRPIGSDHMRMWAKDIVDRVLERRPERVMEIGCGTGMLLFQIAPHCRHYYGSDISQVSLDYVRRQIAEKPQSFGSVALGKRAAHEFDDIESGTYDAIILSSTVQYFPSIDYLLEVIRGCLKTLAPGGFIFFGDIRNQDLLDAFHSSVQQYQADPETTLAEVRSRIARSLARETELAVSPHFFPALRAQFPEIGDVQVYLEAGNDHNELTRFRYHAIVQLGTIKTEPLPETRLACASMDALADHLRRECPDAVCFTHLPNARLADLLEDHDKIQRLPGEMVLRELEANRRPLPAIDPVDVTRLAEEHGYRACLCWSADAPGCFDALLSRPLNGERYVTPLCFIPEPRPLAAYANRPNPVVPSGDFVADLQAELREQLPGFMCPSAYVLLDAMPRTATGKLDRRALPAPAGALPSRTGLAEPRSPLEESLSGIFADLLNAEAVGIYDSFFDLGGHSLLATRLASRVRQIFNLELPLQIVFESPSVAGIAEWIDKHLQRVHDDVPRIAPHPPLDCIPASFAQRRLWFLDRTQITGYAYNIPANLRIRGKLNRQALQDTLNTILQRHEALRTTLHERNGEPIQVIRAAKLDLPVTDLSQLDSERRGAAEQEITLNEARLPFDLETGPLFRARLLMLGPEDFTLLMNFHHISCDGWSMGVFIKELNTLYTAFSQGLPSPLSPLPIQYSDFAVWQRDWEGTPPYRRQMDYWKNQLGNLKPLRLPTDRPRNPVERFRGAGYYFDFPDSITSQLNRINREHGATMYMTLLAALQILFHRYTGDRRIAVGSPIANRNRGEVEGLIGFFVNAMVLATDLGDDPTFDALLVRVRNIVLEAFANQDLPFEKLVEELAPERSLAQNPLINVMFAMQQQEVIEAELHMGDLDVKVLEYGELSVRFDMELHLWHKGSRLKGLALYNTDLFDAATIERLVSHYQQLIAAAVCDRQSPVSQLSILPDAERRLLLQEWSGTAAPYPAESLTSLFEAQVQRTPDAVAIEDGEACWTFRELNRTANRIAHALLRMDLGPMRVVAVSSERSATMLAGLIAILKAGAAYLPIDPETPEPRRKSMLKDAGVRVMLVGKHAEVNAGDVTSLPLDSLQFRRESVENPAACTDPGSIAYICFTSGSTGSPKGIAVPHHAVARLVFNTDYISISAEDRFAHASNVAFDAATFEIWGALLRGARLIVVPRNTVLDAAAYARFLQEQQVSVLFVTTALFNRLADEEPLVFRGLRVLLFGGEAADPLRVRKVLANPPAQLLHVYGPTESTTFATWFRVCDVAPGAATVPIGRALTNTTLYVLDSRLQPTPIGVPGELCIGGDGLSLGYVNHSTLTAEKFIPNPFDCAPGDRLYRTGDLVRFQPDGNLVFLGRIDRQIKLRGFRIEPAEIEARMREYPSVSDAVVSVIAGANEEPQLVGYAVPREPEQGVPDLFRDQVSNWEGVFDEHVYDLPDQVEDPFFNTAGWTSTHDGMAIPVPHMRSWAQDIYDQVLARRPERILEVGCGTGMLLFGLAPHCRQYHGTDISVASLAYVRKLIDSRPDTYAHVTLSRQPADCMDDIQDDYYDAVILSSVVQYFPDIHYLRQVLAGLQNKVRRGGRICLFDLRSLPLLKTFHATVQLFRSGDETRVENLRRTLEQEVTRETELAVDPAFFAALRAREDRVAHVQVRLQTTPYHNELSKFRYSAIVQLDEIAGAPLSRPQHRFTSLDKLRVLLEDPTTQVLAVEAIPNARLSPDRELLLQLAAMDGKSPVWSLRQALEHAEPEGVDPELLRTWATSLGYRLEICWSAGDPYEFDAVFYRGNLERPVEFALAVSDDGRPWSAYANNPLRGKLGIRLSSELRDFLRQQLPEHMVPAHIVVLDQFPLGPTGKVDRNALPPPEELVSRTDSALRRPASPLEEALCGFCAELLGRESVGPDDDFFELGAHSLMATSLAARVSKASGVNLPLKLIFEKPTMAQLARWLAEQSGRSTNDPEPVLARASRSQAPPLSYAQERLWFLDRMEFSESAYHSPVNLRLLGALDTGAMQRSLASVIERHESLRTVFRMENGQPCQCILPPYVPDLPITDLSDLAAEDQVKVGKQMVTEHNRSRFDLEKGPILRFGLLRLRDDEHILMMSIHHIAFDGWSLRILVQELAALLAGTQSDLPPLPVQYSDYAVWQREWLSGSRLETQLQYWRKQLAQLETLRLPTDRPRPRVETFRGDAYSFSLPAAIVRRLKSFNRSRRATTYMTLLAAFQSLLHRYSGQDRITVGTPIAGRNRVEIENLIGFFVNSLVMSTDLGGSPSFDTVVNRVREVTLGAFSHQEVPFERLVECLQPERDLSRNPLFQVLFAVQQPVGELRFRSGNLECRMLEYGEVTVRFDLELHFWEEQNGIQGLFVYNRDLFEAASIERMAGHLTTLLDAALTQPELPISALPLLSEAEEREVLRLGCGDRPARPAPAFLKRFEQKAANQPDAAAVCYQQTTIAYGSLNSAANRASACLRLRGVGADTIVALHFPRGPEAIVAMLAVLKCGAAYLPIDSKLPESRKIFQLSDSDAFLVISGAGEIPGRTPVLSWRELWSEAESQANINPENEPYDLALAYLLYTSGSTGAPKAVAMHYALLDNLVDWHLQSHGDEPMRTLQFTPLTFDVSFQEILTTLCSGGLLCLVSDDEHGDFASLADRLERDHIDRVFMPYTPLRYLLEQASALPLHGLRQIVTAGEALQPDAMLTAFFQRRPQVRLFNHYGPTEAHVVTWHALQETAQEWPSRPPIGRPIQKAHIALLDPQLRLLPRGASGELCIAGLIARGYHRRPDLTAERFVPHPASEEPGARIYRTGDLAAWQHDERLVCLGRLDNQIKLRGFRIEPGEVEATLALHPRVTRAVVGLGGSGKSSLVAWIQPADGQTIEGFAEELRSWVAHRLPAYMVPGFFVWMDRMPLTASGKVKYGALPEPRIEDRETTQPTPPGSAIEAKVLAVFGEVLGVERLGVYDDFFQLGGHSLLATRLAARLAEACQIDVPIRQIFETPTAAGIAQWIVRQSRQNVSVADLPDCVIAIQDQGDALPFFCVAPAGGSPLCYLQLAQTLGGDRPFLGLQSPGLLDPRPPLRSVQEIAAFHLANLRQVQRHGPYFLGGWSFGGIVAYEMARQLVEAGEQVAILALIDSGVGDAEHGFRWYNPVHLIAAPYFIIRSAFQLRVPGSYSEWRALGQWVGISLPPVLSDALRKGRRWRFLKSFVAESRRSLRVFRTNFSAGLNYRPAAIPVKGTLFRVRWPFKGPDPLQATLEKYCSRGVTVHPLSGDHMSIVMKPEDVRDLADRLREALREADRT